jgi:Ca-activated chloride channel family protein
MKTHDIERVLSGQQAPPPPEGLAERIKAEIPEPIEGMPDLDNVHELRPPARRRQWQLAAAAVLMVALTGGITWQLRHTRPSEEAVVAMEGTIDHDNAAEEVVAAAPAGEAGPVVPEDDHDANNLSMRSTAVSDKGGQVTTSSGDGRDTPETRLSKADLSEAGKDLETATRGLRSGVGADANADTGANATAPTDKIVVTAEAPVIDVSGAAGGRPDQTAPAVQATPPGSNARDVFLEVGRQPALREGASATAQPTPVRAQDQELASSLSPRPESPRGSRSEVDRKREEKYESTSDEGVPNLGINYNYVRVDPQSGESTRPGTAAPSEISPSVNGRSRLDAENLRKLRALGYFSAEEIGIEEPAPPSTGGTTEPNDQPYGDVFYREYGVNPFIDTEDDHLSTFGLDVDTGSYTIVRRYLRDGNLPPREAVRIEELVNAFDYGDKPPRRGDFALTAEGAPSPFAEGERYQILRFAVAGRVVDEEQRPPAILTFVVDVSGSMDRENRLGLVKESLFELLDSLREDDMVGLVVYGSRGEVLLEPSADHEAIRRAIGQLRAGGSTNAEEGLVLAYELAARYRDGERINRVILCSDGVANVGRTGPESILERIKGWAAKGIELTTVGFGMGNYNDVLMEQLADSGNGRYAYVDALPEAHRLFVEELTGTLMTIGRDAKAQVDFNPEVVSRYRLLGYENRDIADERFRDPTVDAGEIGAGHTVTALYEVKIQTDAPRNGTVATLRLRYKPMGSDEPVELDHSLEVADLAPGWEKASPALRLASLVAEYGEILKGVYWARTGDLDEVLRRAQRLSPAFAGDPRVADFVSLVAEAAHLKSPGKAAKITE